MLQLYWVPKVVMFSYLIVSLLLFSEHIKNRKKHSKSAEKYVFIKKIIKSVLLFLSICHCAFTVYCVSIPADTLHPKLLQTLKK